MGWSPGTGLQWDLTDFPGNGPQDLSRPRMRRVLPLCLQVLASASLSLFFFAVLGPSRPPALGSSHPRPPFCLFSFLFSSPSPQLPFCLFFSLWSPLGLCSQEGTDGVPPIFPGVPSLTRVPLQSVSPGGMFCEVSLLQGMSIPPCHTTPDSLGK